ncbi:hypothetical protein [Frankia tisae]|uniref:hypothetical protein n=2 Tax=Frankia tisae TaxID=2950104 RepID=UPI0021C24161|nr:hypothetical protein [Frankia tisae]
MPGGRPPVHGGTPRPEPWARVDLTGRAAQLAVPVGVAVVALARVPRLRPGACRAVPRRRSLPARSSTRAAPRIPPAPGLPGLAPAGSLVPGSRLVPASGIMPAHLARLPHIARLASTGGMTPDVMRTIRPGQLPLGPLRASGRVRLASAGIGPGRVGAA